MSIDARPLGMAQSRRLSIGMFVHPNYPAISAGEHIKRKIERSHEAA